MKSIITLGQALIVFVTGIGPLVYYSLSDIALEGSRNYKIEYEFKNLAGEGVETITREHGKSERYQGIPNEKVCMGNNKSYESVYDIRFKDGSSIEANGWRAGGSGVSIKEPFEVIEKKSYVEGEKWVGAKEESHQTLDSKIKENLRLIVYKDGEGKFGAILVGSVKDMWWTEYKKENLVDRIDDRKLSKFIDHIKTGEFAVRRSVKGVWSKLTDFSCDKKRVRDGEPIYKNYGVLVQQWNDKTSSTKPQQFQEGIAEEVVVLDWIDFGFKNIEPQKGEWAKPSNKDGSLAPDNAIGRWDYWRPKSTNKPFEVIVGKLEDIAISKEGISDGKGNKILWSDQFKPTKWEVSLIK
ncbi:hypothetical protein WEN_02630 [Mycoplasma wenyonii str. Massachusetts]|uniref:Uncharacterized protein n=1 Tax=Mycoplasma wenyonii (strain Massachusetts) TaxID=1197325 RepID=I6YBE6_MYCWM|nr:hypothetical protein [Mycoplasma wenyonii]AFN65311.1 hypothetical protein WEN_02630 [Mycoplasma wenyonii str. Massachusetts]